MSLLNFEMIAEVFAGGSITDEEQQALYTEVMFMVLSRATAADLNIESVEVDTVIGILKNRLDQDFSSRDIRVAAQTDLYTKAPFERYVVRSARKLSVEQRKEILDATVEVFKANDIVGSMEIDYFNTVADMLHMTPAQIAGL